MRWPWQRKRIRLEPELTLPEISARLKGFLLDTQVENAQEISVILGCMSSSEEGMLHEEDESDKRMERIAYLVPLIYSMSNILATGTIEFQRSELPEDTPELPDELFWDSRKLLEQVAFAALSGGISQIVDMGLLEVPKGMRK